VEVRLLNIEADAGSGLGLFDDLHGSVSPDAFARELKDAARNYYGTTFRAFLQRLTSDWQELERNVRSVRETFIQRFVPAGGTGDLKRSRETHEARQVLGGTPTGSTLKTGSNWLKIADSRAAKRMSHASTNSLPAARTRPSICAMVTRRLVFR
jgi:hypothetical protein